VFSQNSILISRRKFDETLSFTTSIQQQAFAVAKMPKRAALIAHPKAQSQISPRAMLTTVDQLLSLLNSSQFSHLFNSLGQRIRTVML
jgi:hypothetical protein